MIQGPGPLYICDQCIALAVELIDEEILERDTKTMVRATANFSYGSLGEEIENHNASIEEPKHEKK